MESKLRSKEKKLKEVRTALKEQTDKTIFIQAKQNIRKQHESMWDGTEDKRRAKS
jgi:hypothetical protein